MTRYVSLGEYLWLAEQTGVDAAVLAKTSRTDLADPALHPPGAGFGGPEFYVEPIEKAGVLVCRRPGDPDLVLRAYAVTRRGRGHWPPLAVTLKLLNHPPSDTTVKAPPAKNRVGRER